MITLLDKDDALFKLQIYSSEDRPMEIRNADFVLREGINNALYASFFDPEQNESNRLYYWLMLRLVEDSCIVWAPQGRTYEQAIKEGKIKGRIIEGEPNQIILEDTNERILGVLATTGLRGDFWDWETPRIFMKKLD